VCNLVLASKSCEMSSSHTQQYELVLPRAEVFTLSYALREFGHGDPELLNRRYDLGQHFNAVWLRDIAVRMVVIRIVNVPVGTGRGEYENRNFA
jgi:hypothetical protein